MKKTIFKGAGVAIITPFNENGVDYDAFGKLIDFQLANKTDAIIVCGTTGEASTMPDREHLEAIEFTVKRVNKKVPVIAGTGSNDTLHACELCREAYALGVDGLLSVTPYYNKTTQRGLIEHYKMIAASTPLPIILYNVPSRTGLNITAATLKELSKVENIVAIKEASGNIALMAKMAAECPDMDIYSGNDDMIVPALSLGAKGVISVASNIVPEDVHNMCQYYFDGNVESSRELQLKMFDLIESLFIEVNPIPVKTAVNLMGMNGGKLRMPLYEMDPKNKEILKNSMINYGIKNIK